MATKAHFCLILLFVTSGAKKQVGPSRKKPMSSQEYAFEDQKKARAVTLYFRALRAKVGSLVTNACFWLRRRKSDLHHFWRGATMSVVAAGFQVVYTRRSRGFAMRGEERC